MKRMLLAVLVCTCLFASSLAAAPTTTPPPSIGALQLELDGIAAAFYTSCDSIGSESEVIEATTGGSLTTIKLPGKTTFLNITCSRLLSSDKTLWTWRKQLENGNLQRKNGSVILLDTANQEITRFNFGNGWPQSLKISAINTNQSEQQVSETVSIVIESLNRP